MGYDDADDAVIVEGAEDARSKVLAFLEKLAKNPEVDGEVTIHLCQHGQGDDDPIYQTHYEPTTGLGELADELVEQAVEDCEGLNARQMKYTVRAEGLAGRATFTLKCSQPEEEDLEDIEDLPNRKGLMRQMMRHQEAVMKLNVGTQKTTVEMLTRTIEQRDKRIAELEGKYLENMKAYEELVNGRHMRDLELQKLENSERRKDQVASILMAGAPILVNKFLGGGAAAGAAGGGGAGARSPLEHMMEGFMASLDQKQFESIMNSGMLKPEQIMILMEVFKYIMERKQAEESARNAHQNGAPPQQPEAQGAPRAQS